MKRFIFAAIFAAIATPVTAQDMRQRVEGIVNQIDPTGGVFNQSNMESVVVPYETSAPPESQLEPSQFDAEELQRQTEDTPAAQAYAADRDSALNRPEVDLGTDPLALADSAVEQADAVVGGLFSSDGGQCSQGFVADSRFQGMQWCRSIVTRNIQSCNLARNVAVDRRDTWSCDIETGTYLKTCNKSVSWRCSGSSGAACRQWALNIWPLGKTWDAAGNNATVNIPNRSNGTCSLKTDTFYINRRDALNLNSLELRDLYFFGVAQVRVNGANVWTYGTSRTGNIYVANRGCGKNCSVPAVYSNGAWIEDCGSPGRVLSPRIGLAGYVGVGRPGPSVESGLSSYLQMGKVSGAVRIDVVRINTAENWSWARIGVTGACCSAFAATVGGTC